jgi:hypothetical protein
MRICLLDNSRAGAADEPAAYVGELGPALAEEHRVAILTLEPGLAHWLKARRRVRRMLATERPDIIHLNNLSGLTLAAVLAAVGAQPATLQPPTVVGLHDDRLLRGFSSINRRLTGPIGLVVSPSARLLDQHLERGFFDRALTDVIPYGMPYHAARVAQAYRRVIIARRTGGLDHNAA